MTTDEFKKEIKAACDDFNKSVEEILGDEMDIAELKRLAECSDNVSVDYEPFNNSLLIDIPPYHYGFEGFPSKVGLFVAAANPKTILTLIECLEKAKEALEFYAARSKHHPLGGDRARQALEFINERTGE